MIALTHVGERLLAEMYGRSPSVRAELAQRVGPAVVGRRAVPEAPLASYGSLRFDGASRIDVALVNDSSSKVMACEAKLGVDRLGAREFDSRFLAPCCTSHQGTRVRGSMPAILDRKLPASKAPLLARIDDRELEVEPTWILVVRLRVAERWIRRGRPGLSRRCHVVPFEDLVAAYGGRDPFNALVRELLDVDYFGAWLI